MADNSGRGGVDCPTADFVACAKEVEDASDVCVSQTGSSCVCGVSAMRRQRDRSVVSMIALTALGLLAAPDEAPEFDSETAVDRELPAPRPAPVDAVGIVA